MCEFYIEQVTWVSHESALRLVREQVFVVEQRVPSNEEWDHFDAGAIHLLAYDNAHRPIGCTRVLHDGKIGRMAVLTIWRGQGVGRALLAKAVEICKLNGSRQVSLSSQMHAVGFYEQAGFKITSKAYLDVSIWHVNMQLLL